MSSDTFFSESYRVQEATGEWKDISVKIYLPEKSKNGFQAKVILEGLFEDLMPIGGPSKFQAIHNAFIFVKTYLEGFVKRGNTIYIVINDGGLEEVSFG